MKVDFDFVKELEKMLVGAYEQTKTWNDFNVKNKELNDIVTDVDIFMERTIVNKLMEWFPKYSIYSEEMGRSKNGSEYEWLIDPIDGTINFSSGIPLFATSIALRKNNETIFGYIYDYTRKKILLCNKRKRGIL